jgi:hypothetical protein
VIDRNEIRVNAIEITVSGSFKTDHRFSSADGVLGVLSLNGVKSEGRFRGRDGSNLVLKKNNPWKFHYQLEDGSVILGTAQPLKTFSRRVLINYQGQSFELTPNGFLTRSWALQEPGKGMICEIKPRGMFKRGALQLIYSEVALNLLIFAYGLVVRRWQEESSAG